MSIKMLLRLLRSPVFFLVKSKWVERNEPLMIVDTGSDLKHLLRREGNEKAEYVLVGFRVNP